MRSCRPSNRLEKLDLEILLVMILAVMQGVIIYGCLRDSEAIEALPLGVKALNTHPFKSSKRDPGLRDVPVTFGSTTFRPGDWLYADKDGVLVSSTELKIE